MFIWGIWNLLNSLTEEPISTTKRITRKKDPYGEDIFGPLFVHETKLTGQRHCSHRCEACHYERHSPYSN